MHRRTLTPSCRPAGTPPLGAEGRSALGRIGRGRYGQTGRGARPHRSRRRQTPGPAGGFAGRTNHRQPAQLQGRTRLLRIRKAKEGVHIEGGRICPGCGYETICFRYFILETAGKRSIIRGSHRASTDCGGPGAGPARQRTPRRTNLVPAPPRVRTRERGPRPEPSRGNVPGSGGRRQRPRASALPRAVSSGARFECIHEMKHRPRRTQKRPRPQAITFRNTAHLTPTALCGCKPAPNEAFPESFRRHFERCEKVARATAMGKRGMRQSSPVELPLLRCRLGQAPRLVRA